MLNAPEAISDPGRRAARSPEARSSGLSTPDAPSRATSVAPGREGVAPKPGRRGRLLLADRHVLVLEGLRSLLGSEFEVVSCARDVADLEQDARRLAPDLVVVGAGRPGGGGLRLLERVRAIVPLARVVVLAGDPDPRLAAEAFRLGARGLVVRSSSVAELRTALRTVLRGGRFLTRLVADGNVDSLLGSADPGPGVLTPREREVVRLTAEGRIMKEVGAALGISARTVAFHKYRAMGKVGARSSAELVRFAVRAMMT